MANLETIRIGLGALSANQCIPWLCREARLFREEGLDAVITFEPPAVRTLAVVVDGEVDVGLFGGYPVVRAAVECKNAEIVLNLNGFNHLSIVAQPGIESPRDLKGRRIGGFSLKGNADFTLDLLFAEWGLTGEPGDPERVPYWDGFQAACEGLLAGEVEAAILPLPFSGRAVKAGHDLSGRRRVRAEIARGGEEGAGQPIPPRALHGRPAVQVRPGPGPARPAR